ncbi:hypothetical protein [Paraburkholderia sp.]|uniref:hypothetical protein n=1 Tax=Paraburkholderia sp. TaxID=1926495 RepID=UPI003D6F0E78
MADKNLVLRTVYMDPDIDDELRDEAYAGRRSKNDLVRMYIKMGMEAAKLGATLGKPVVIQKANKVVVSDVTARSGTAARAKSTPSGLTKSVPAALLQKKPSGMARASAAKAASARRASPARKAAAKRAAVG